MSLVWLPFIKLRELSQPFVIDVVEDQADLIVRFEEASDHAGVVEDLRCTFD